jgi:hypothetical protein
MNLTREVTMNSRYLWRAAALVSALAVAGLASGSASAGRFGGGGGGDNDHDYNADKSGIYQAMRGDLVCNSREACGGPAAIPMNRPGWFYLPGGTYRLPQGRYRR